MKIFASKKIWKKLFVIFLIIILFSFASPEPVGASIGGELMSPICDFLVAVCDGIMDAVHHFFLGQDDSTIDIDLTDGLSLSDWKTIRTWLFGAGCVIGLLCFPIASLGIAALTAGALIATAASFTATALISAGIEIATQTDPDTEITIETGIIAFENDWFEDEIYLPVYNIGPEEIFRNTIDQLNANFFDTSNSSSNDDIISKLYNSIAGWYYAILMIAIVGMLSVLVYIGIRILISSAASDKAKYKQLLGDWLIGMILLFAMHYIMVFANYFVDIMTDFLNSGDLGMYTLVIEDTAAGQSRKNSRSTHRC